MSRLATLVVLAIAGTSAHANPREARLEVASEGCAELDLRTRVAALAGRDPFDAGAPSTVRVTTSSDAGGLRGNVSMIDATGSRSRTLEASSCDQLADAIALVITIALARSEPIADVRTVAVAPPRRERAVEQPLALHATTRSRSPGRFEIVAGAMTDDRRQPAAFLGARVRRSSTSFGLELALAAPEVMEVNAGRVSVSRGGATLLACAHHGQLGLCGTADLGWLRGRGEGLAVVRTATTPYVGAGGRLGWDHGITQGLGVQAHLGVQAWLTSNRFFVDEMAVWSSRRIEARLGLAVVAQLP